MRGKGRLFAKMAVRPKDDFPPFFQQRLKLVRVLDEIPAMVLRLNHQLKVVWANRWLLQCLGKNLDRIQGQDGTSLMAPPEQRQALKANLLGILEHGGILTTQGLLFNERGGAPAMVVWRHVAYRDQAGQAEMVCLGRDITHQYETEKALQRATLQLAQVASLLDRSSLITLRTRLKKGRIVKFEFIRGSCQAITGYHPLEFQKNRRLLVRLLPPSWARQVYSRVTQFAEQARTGESLTLEFPIIRKHGHACWVEQTMWVSRLFPDEETIELESFVQDITRRKEAEDSLRLLTAGVAHNFNNLLAAALSNTQAAITQIQGDSPEMPKVRRLLGNVVDSVESGRYLVKRLTAYVGHDDRQQKEGAVVDLAELAATALDLAKNAWMPKGDSKTEFVCDFSGALYVKALRGELLEVLLNLVKNSLEAMPQGGTLTLTGGKDREQAVLSISDTGQGMYPETASRAFEPFFSTKGLSGRGLGLSSSRGIVRSYGGELEATSQPGRGTTFTLLLPLTQSKPAEPEGAEAQVMAVKVLLVEDDALVAMGMTAVLEQAGHEVRTANKVGSAIRELSDFRPDVVLCDLGLPDEAGWEVARHLAGGLYAPPPPPFVLITGWSQQGKLFEPPAGVPPAWGVLHKPVDRVRLLKIVSEAAGPGRSDSESVKDA